MKNLETTLNFLEGHLFILKNNDFAWTEKTIESTVGQCFNFLELNINKFYYEEKEVDKEIIKKAMDCHKQFIELARQKKYDVPKSILEFLKRKPMLRKAYEKQWKEALIQISECFNYKSVISIIFEFVRQARAGDNYKLDKTYAIFDNKNYDYEKNNEIFHLFLANEIPLSKLLNCVEVENWLKLTSAIRKIRELKEINELQKFVYNVNI